MWWLGYHRQYNLIFIVIMRIEKKIKIILILSFILFVFNSIPKSWALGVAFTERISFSQDGSGLYSLTFDLTKSKKLIAAIKYLNKDYEQIPKLIGYNAFFSAKTGLEKIKGMDDIRIWHDPKMLSITLRFAFKNIPVLNKAMCTINEGIDPEGITYFSLNDQIFIREDMHGLAKKLVLYQNYDNSLIKSLTLSAFFRDTTYTTIYTFSKKIKDASNPLSEITKDKQTIRVVHHILSADEVEESIRNRIHFRVK